MYKGKTVGVIFPTYNEQDNILSAITSFSEHPCVDEVMVVDNNSSDLTKSLTLQTKAAYVFEPVQGYGSASIAGLKKCKQDLLVIVEPDGTFSSSDLDLFLAYSEKYDAVFGSRTSRNLIWDNAFMPHWVRIGNWICAKELEFLWGGPSLTDVGCTYKLFHRESIQVIQENLTVKGSHFSPHLMIECLRRKLKIIEIPINYYSRVGNSKITGGNNLRTIRLGVVMFFYIFTMRVKSLYA